MMSLQLLPRTRLSKLVHSPRAMALGAMLVLAWSTARGEQPATAAAPAEPTFYEDAVAPLLQKHCTDCHDAETREGRLDLTTAEGLLQGSESGSVVTPRQASRSLLYEMVHSGEMPPGGPRLSSDEMKVIGDWIDSGAQFRTPPRIAEAPPSQHDVLPILLLRCTACHGAELQRGGVDLRTVALLKKGGDSGPVAISGDAAASRMIQRIETQQCPPSAQMLKYFVERPGTTEVETLKKWIAAGLPEAPVPPEVIDGLPDPHIKDSDRERWAFQPLPKSTPVPEFDGIDLPQPIDAFVYQKLAENGLDFSPPAPRQQLIRRVYFDLTGLPPTPAELKRWDQEPGEWYPALIDDLLASPRYGERWGRYWLDVAGYADSEGGVAEDPVRDTAWKYRDYVIRSLNADKPWDRFLHEQIAGDELADYRDPQKVTEEIVDNMVATGFLRMTVDQTGSRTMNFAPERIGLISDVINVVSSGVLGLTMDCARCHSHKYDPIPQGDYYRFKAVFQGAFDEHDWMSWKTRKLDVATPAAIAERAAVNGPLEKEIKQLEAKQKKLLASWQDRIYAEAWPKLDAALQQEIEAAVKVRTKRPTPRQKELIARYDDEFRPTEKVLAARHPEFAAELKQLTTALAEHRGRLLPPPTVRALWDRGRPSPTYLLVRGEYNRPGRLVGPGVPSVLVPAGKPFVAEPPWPGAESTGRRLALARWLTEPDHPLTARVFVNRVWSHHFGRGIVKTLDNFGALGSPPTHPELLDWLARDFVNGGWRLKSLHRTILLSRTYRQSSGAAPSDGGPRDDAADLRRKLDPENELLSRMPLRRLDAEALRDAVLAVSGAYDDTMYGPPAPVTARQDGLITENESATGKFRRSIYLQMRRTEIPTLLSAFDYPDMQPNCSERPVSTVATQSLVLMNNASVHRLAQRFAQAVFERCSGQPAVMVAEVYRAAYQRDPRPDELWEGEQSLKLLGDRWVQSGATAEEASRNALATWCHAVLNSAEFAYID